MGWGVWGGGLEVGEGGADGGGGLGCAAAGVEVGG